MNVVILKQPGQDVTRITGAIRTAARKRNLIVEIEETANFAAFSHLSINFSQTPIVIIHNKVEFVKQLPPLPMLEKKLFDLEKRGGMAF